MTNSLDSVGTLSRNKYGELCFSGFVYSVCSGDYGGRTFYFFLKSNADLFYDSCLHVDDVEFVFVDRMPLDMVQDRWEVSYEKH